MSILKVFVAQTYPKIDFWNFHDLIIQKEAQRQPDFAREFEKSLVERLEESKRERRSEQAA